MEKDLTRVESSKFEDNFDLLISCIVGAGIRVQNEGLKKEVKLPAKLAYDIVEEIRTEMDGNFSVIRPTAQNVQANADFYEYGEKDIKKFEKKAADNNFFKPLLDLIDVWNSVLLDDMPKFETRIYYADFEHTQIKKIKVIIPQSNLENYLDGHRFLREFIYPEYRISLIQKNTLPYVIDDVLYAHDWTADTTPEEIKNVLDAELPGLSKEYIEYAIEEVFEATH